MEDFKTSRVHATLVLRHGTTPGVRLMGEKITIRYGVFHAGVVYSVHIGKRAVVLRYCGTAGLGFLLDKALRERGGGGGRGGSEEGLVFDELTALFCNCTDVILNVLLWLPAASGVKTAVGDPSEELQRMEALSKEKTEAAEEADYRAKERGHVRQKTSPKTKYTYDCLIGTVVAIWSTACDSKNHWRQLSTRLLHVHL